MDRSKLVFKYFFNAGFDHVTCQCDVEGTDVYYDDVYCGQVVGKKPSELEEMDDDSLEDIFYENGVLV